MIKKKVFTGLFVMVLICLSATLGRRQTGTATELGPHTIITERCTRFRQ
jgi:hypothetical protein